MLVKCRAYNQVHICAWVLVYRSLYFRPMKGPLTDRQSGLSAILEQ